MAERIIVEELVTKVDSLTRRFEEFKRIVSNDIGKFKGNAFVDDPQFLDRLETNTKLSVRSVVPSGQDRDGTIVLYENGVTRRLYAKVNGTWRYVALT